MMWAITASRVMRPSSSGWPANESSLAVETCAMWNCVLYFLASSTAKEDDCQQASSLRISQWWVMSGSSPKRSLAAFIFWFMIPESSQCVITGSPKEAATRKVASKESRWSTSIFPVEAPMKSFIPGIVWMSNCPNNLLFVFVAPKKKL